MSFTTVNLPTTTTTTTRGYGCQREVYHPLSSRAEPSAITYYESSDEEDEVGVIGNATPIPGKKSIKPIASPIATSKNALVPRKENATRPSPKKASMVAAGNKELLDRKGKGKAVEKPSPPRSLMLLDEMMTAPQQAVPSSPTARRPPPPAAAPSTPPRPKRTPFNVLTPENTFGASSPFKTRPPSSIEKSLFKTHHKDKENSDGDYNYGSIPGGFDDVNLHTLFEIPQGTGVIFSDTRGFFTSLFLFILSVILEGLTYYVVRFRSQDGWAGVSI